MTAYTHGANLGEEVAKLLKVGTNLADNLHEELLTVTTVNVSPVILGGPYTNTIKEVHGKPYWEGIRPTAVRGVWRWWVRALLAGILWDSGVRDYDYQRLAEIEARKLGLGSIDTGRGIRGEASKLIIEVRVNDVTDPLPEVKFKLKRARKYIVRRRSGKYGINAERLTQDLLTHNTGGINGYYHSDPSAVLLSIPRYLLSVMDEIGRNPYDEVPHKLYLRQPIPPGGLEAEFTLRSRGKVSDAVAMMGAVALILTLTLGGLGQAGSRAFGKMRVKGVGGRMSDQVEGIMSNLRKMEKGYTSAESLLKNVMESLREARGLKDIVREVQASSGNWPYLPKVPTFHTDTLMLRVINKPKCHVRGRPFPVKDSWSALIAVGRACLKTEWKIIKRAGRYASGRALHTWPLGLPRNVRGKGYILRGNGPGRLTSLVRFTILESDNTGNCGILVYAFKTGDLETLRKSLLHVGVRRLPVSRIGIHYKRSVEGIDYLKDAFDTVVSLLS